MQVYVADYTADVQHLTCEQDGAYWRILRAMWRAGGSLPDDDRKLANICGLTLSKWSKIGADVMALLRRENGVVTQKRLTSEIEKAQKKSKKRSEAGKLGAEAKALKNNETHQANAEPLLKHSLEPEPEIEGFSIENPPPTPQKGARKKREIEYTEDFEKWYGVYPRKTAKLEAAKAFPEALRKAPSLDALVFQTQRYAAEVVGRDPKFIAHPASWLNGRRWEDAYSDERNIQNVRSIPSSAPGLERHFDREQRRDAGLVEAVNRRVERWGLSG